MEEQAPTAVCRSPFPCCPPGLGWLVTCRVHSGFPAVLLRGLLLLGELGQGGVQLFFGAFGSSHGLGAGVFHRGQALFGRLLFDLQPLLELLAQSVEFLGVLLAHLGHFAALQPQLFLQQPVLRAQFA